MFLHSLAFFIEVMFHWERTVLVAGALVGVVSAIPLAVAVSTSVDTLFISDLHVGDGKSTWSTVDAALANFRETNPSATYLVYAGDTIKHDSTIDDGEADQYISHFIMLATHHGFSVDNIFVAQGNNDGPHDQPLSPKWASAVAASGIVPAEEQSTCNNASYYAKCSSAGVCGIVVNTDLEVYGSGIEEAEDKAMFNASLTTSQVAAILQAKQDQQAWVKAKANEYHSKGRPFFMVGHHPQLSDFFGVPGSFQGGIAGHLHWFRPTGVHAAKLTLLPGYTGMGLTQGYVQGSLQGLINIQRSNLVHYDYNKGCFFPDGGSCNPTDSVLV